MVGQTVCVSRPRSSRNEEVLPCHFKVRKKKVNKKMKEYEGHVSDGEIFFFSRPRAGSITQM